MNSPLRSSLLTLALLLAFTAPALAEDKPAGMPPLSAVNEAPKKQLTDDEKKQVETLRARNKELRAEMKANGEKIRAITGEPKRQKGERSPKPKRLDGEQQPKP